VGVPVDLPKTEAGALNDQDQPLNVSLSADGKIFVQDQLVGFDQLAPRMTALNGTGAPRAVFVRADGKAPYALVAQVMASLSRSGFSSIGLITDIGGPSSGKVSDAAKSVPARP
jgi:biopolymer transport protein TolR